MEIIKKENMFGGKGYVTLKMLLNEKQMNGKIRVFAESTIKPGHSLGYHVHHNDSETFYILSGVGEFNDNGTVRTVRAGDVTFTPDGCGHGMENNGTEDLVMMALVIYD
jgi:mannose-6-phosphate isomerase-like protein (cupin superfamily)